jgi:hypothetical protein
MNDSHSPEARPALREPDRESRAEALLVEGLDQYLAGHYEDAIHVWTRVLFLDRGHQRARAYIERARSALAERERRAEEMLHRTEYLVEQGALEDARALLSELAQTSIDDARVAALWTNIDRVERVRTTAPTAPETVRDGGVIAAPAASPKPWSAESVLRWTAIVAAGALVLTIGTSRSIRGWFGASEFAMPSASTGRPPELVVPSSSEIALTRARTLYARGRLAEALAVLDRVSPTSAERAAIDAFRVEIQSVLLSTVVAPSSEGSRP